MAIANIHKLYPVSVETDAMGAAVVIGSITSQSIIPNIEVLNSVPSGSTYWEQSVVSAVNPVGNFVTQDLTRALDTISLSGLCITATTNPGVQMYAQSRDCTGIGGTHIIYTIREGILILGELTVDHQDHAELSCQALMTYDGTNAPYTISTGSLPSFSLGDDRWTMHDFKLNSVSLPQKTQITINFGQNASVRSGDSDIYPTFAVLESVTPSITITGIDATWYNDVALSGTKGFHIGTELVLRKQDNLNASSVHIKFTMNGLARIETTHDATDDGDVEMTIVFDALWDGGNAPLIVDTTYAIP